MRRREQRIERPKEKKTRSEIITINTSVNASLDRNTPQQQQDTTPITVGHGENNILKWIRKFTIIF